MIVDWRESKKWSMYEDTKNWIVPSITIIKYRIDFYNCGFVSSIESIFH